MNKVSTIIQDGAIEISVGRSRKEIIWRNQTVQWSKLLARLQAPTRTKETAAEYAVMTKQQRDGVKDVGGFVGGYLENGRRKGGNVKVRSLITLDVDYATQGFWESLVERQYNCAAAIYSTHSHTKNKPRLRLLLPLSRPVTADEYQAISRRVAGDLGIEQFDNTTFEPERLMYWPSCSKDQEYIFEYQDGTWLNADEALGPYRDWRDVTAWPVSEAVHTAFVKELRKAAEPETKPGLIGAFNRRYTIQAAIDTFLEGLYTPCDSQGRRYSYAKGTSTQGAVVYQDKFLYSHHATDPACGMLCNSFDLVRIHLFGDMDKEVEDIDVTKRKSYKAMMDLCGRDNGVCELLLMEKQQQAEEEFHQGESGDEEEGKGDTEETDYSWMEGAERNKNGDFKPKAQVILRALSKDPNLKGAFRRNSFSMKDIAVRDLPWRKVTTSDEYLTDADDSCLRNYMDSVYGINSVQKIRDGFEEVLMRNSYHPVREYLNALPQWDGVCRLDTLLCDYLGAEDNIYVRAVTRKIFTAAVARIYAPGCKFDYMLVLAGPQGIGKSSLIRIMGSPWTSDSFSLRDNSTRANCEQLQGVWIVEVAELAGLRKSEENDVKSFLSKQDDLYRVAYGRRLQTYPRQCVFFATCNDYDFLKDTTGNRRFWPVDTGCAGIDIRKNIFKELEGEKDQLWAEAIYYYEQGEKLYLDKKEVCDIALQVQETHSDEDDRIGIIEDYLDRLLPATWNTFPIEKRRSYLDDNGTCILTEADMPLSKRKRVSIQEIWCECLCSRQDLMTQQNTKPIHKIMKGLNGWKRDTNKRRFSIYGVCRGYIREE